jgi:hypothetical protein
MSKKVFNRGECIPQKGDMFYKKRTGNAGYARRKAAVLDLFRGGGEFLKTPTSA